MNHLPYLLPWVRVMLLIRSITSTTWGHEAWPQVKPVLRRALEMRRQILPRRPVELKGGQLKPPTRQPLCVSAAPARDEV